MPSKKENWLNHLAFEIERIKAHANELVKYFHSEAIREQTLAFYAEREAIEQERARKYSDTSPRQITPLQRAKELVKLPLDAWVAQFDNAMSSTRAAIQEAVQDSMTRLTIAPQHQPIIAAASEHALLARQLVPNIMRMLPTPTPSASGKMRFEEPAELSHDDLKDIHIDFHQDLRDKRTSLTDTLNNLLQQQHATPSRSADLMRDTLLPHVAAMALDLGMARHMTHTVSGWPDLERQALIHDARQIMRDRILTRSILQALSQSPICDMLSHAIPTCGSTDNPYAYFQSGDGPDYLSGPKPSCGPVIEDLDELTRQVRSL